MSAIITISAFQYKLAGGLLASDAVELRVFYTGSPGSNFIDADGSVVPYGSATNLYLPVTCTVSAGEVNIPSFDLSATDNSSNISAQATAQFFVNGAPSTFLFTGWIITSTLGASISYNSLYTYNLSAQLAYILDTLYLTAPQVAALIASTAGAFLNASATVKGISKLSVAPLSATNPIAVGDNDPRLSTEFLYDITHAPYNAAVGNTAAANATAIAAANTAAAATGAGIYIPIGLFTTNSVTISVPATFANGAGSQLLPAAGQTVTFTKTLNADLSQHFAGLGLISFAGNCSLLEIFVQWWGGAGNDSTDNLSAAGKMLAAALTATTQPICRFVAGTYRFGLNTGSLAPSGTYTLQGDGIGQTILSFPSGATGGRTFFLPAAASVGTFNDLTIQGYNTGSTTADPTIAGIWHQGTSGGITLNRVKLNLLNTALKLQPGASLYANSIEISNNRGAGILGVSTNAATTGSITVVNSYFHGFTSLTGIGSSVSEFMEVDLPQNQLIVFNSRFEDGPGLALATREGDAAGTNVSLVIFQNNLVRLTSGLGGIQLASGDIPQAAVVKNNLFDLVSGNAIQVAVANFAASGNSYEGGATAITVTGTRAKYGSVQMEKFYNDGGSVIFNDAAQRGWSLKGNIHNRRSSAVTSPYVDVLGVIELTVADIFYSKGQNSITIRSGANKIDLSGSVFIGTAANPAHVSITSTAGTAGALTGTGGTNVKWYGTGFSVVIDTVTGAYFSDMVDGSANGTSLSGGATATLLPASATGTGAGVRQTSPTIVTPTVASFTNATHNHSNAAGGGQVSISSGISGLAANIATFLGTPSSANLAAALTDETGTGAAVFGTSPTITTSLILADAANIVVNATTGSQIATAVGQKVAFHGSTPVIQRAGAAQAAAAATAATNAAPYGYTTAAQADAIITLLNEIRAVLVEKGIMKGSA